VLIQVSLVAIISGLIYGFALVRQTHNYWYAIIIKIIILTIFMLYLLNLNQLLFILIAILVFLSTFWMVILRLER